MSAKDLMPAMLRVSGASIEIDGCLEWLPRDKLNRLWRNGEKDRGDKYHTTSGFNLLLAESDDKKLLVEEAAVAFLVLAPNIARLIGAGAKAEIDFGLFVTEKQSQSIRLVPDLLQMIAQYGVAIVVSAYPCSSKKHRSKSKKRRK